jgi:hypothetical protein
MTASLRAAGIDKSRRREARTTVDASPGSKPLLLLFRYHPL